MYLKWWFVLLCSSLVIADLICHIRHLYRKGINFPLGKQSPLKQPSAAAATPKPCSTQGKRQSTEAAWGRHDISSQYIFLISATLPRASDAHNREDEAAVNAINKQQVECQDKEQLYSWSRSEETHGRAGQIICVSVQRFSLSTECICGCYFASVSQCHRVAPQTSSLLLLPIPFFLLQTLQLYLEQNIQIY